VWKNKENMPRKQPLLKWKSAKIGGKSHQKQESDKIDGNHVCVENKKNAVLYLPPKRNAPFRRTQGLDVLFAAEEEHPR